ncbi:MAG: AmmeMemoRadiSam system protein A [Burkholderiales bacterium]
MPNDAGSILPTLARAAIAWRLGLEHDAHASHARLAEPAACFVTLHKHGELRGCVGSLEAHRPLGDDVRANALAAAFSDPRFTPLGVDEFEHISIEVSVLSPSERIEFINEREALTKLRPFVDGVILEYGRARGTFLPQVWRDLPEPSEFLAHLKLKAGLRPDFWDTNIRLARYCVTTWNEGARS